MRARFAVIALLSLLPIFSLIGCNEDRQALSRIAPDQTCMASNRATENPTIRVRVGKSSYYGCSEMCAVNLEKNPPYRYGVDPFSGKRVDKADALLAARPNGELLYFESMETFLAYQRRGEG